MAPELRQHLLALDDVQRGAQHALEHAGELAHVEKVVELGRRRQKGALDLGPNLDVLGLRAASGRRCRRSRPSSRGTMLNMKNWHSRGGAASACS